MDEPTDCEDGLLFEAFTPWDFAYQSFGDHGSFDPTTAGDDSWMGWVPVLATRQQGDEIWYEWDQEFVDQIDGFHLYDQYVLRWRGQITIDTQGEYTFMTASDDGSMVIIDGVVIVDNDGLHGTEEEQGTVDLAQGEHDIVIIHFENWGGSTMMVSWTPTPGGSFERLDATYLSNDAGCTGVRGYQFKSCASDTDCGTPAMSCSMECAFGDCADGMDDHERLLAAAMAEFDDSETCRQECAAAGFCCNDWLVGSNQLISCAQACMIRKRGTPQAECEDKCTTREQNRRCETHVNGFTYTHCSTCDDLDDTCPHGVQDDSNACQTGCAMQGGDSGGGGGFCQPTELCISWLHIDGVCPGTGSVTDEQRSCLAAADAEMPSPDMLEMMNEMGDDMLFDMMMMSDTSTGVDPMMDPMMMDPMMMDPMAMDWDTTMSSTELDWDEVDFDSDANTYDILGEIGMVSTGDSDSTVYYMGSYVDPVFIAGIPTANGPDGQALVRIRSVDTTAGTVTFYVDTPECGSGTHPIESFSWCVGDSGSYGAHMLGKLDVSGVIDWETQTFPTGLFSASPLVVSQVQTHNDDDWVNTRQRLVTQFDFQVCLEEDGSYPTEHPTETVGFLALSMGTGFFGDLKFEAMSFDGVTHDVHHASFSSPFTSMPGVFGSIATYRGGDPAALRLASSAADGAGPCFGGTFGCQAISFGLIEYETRFWPGATSIGHEDTYSTALAAFEALDPPDWTYYCSTSMWRADTLSNRMACGFLGSASDSDIAFHYTIPVTAYASGSYEFRLHVDWGGGGITCVQPTDTQDQAPDCETHHGDIWGHVFWSADTGVIASESGVTAELNMIGFEGCCDGHAELEFALPSACTCSDEPQWLMVDMVGDYECRCEGAVTTDSAQFFIEEETCSDPEQNHISEVVHVLAIDIGLAITVGPDTCTTQTEPTCDEALTLMANAVELDSGALPVEVTKSTSTGFPHMFKFAPVPGLLLETEALDGIEPHLQVFTSDGLRAYSNGGWGELSFDFPPEYRYPCIEESFDGWHADFEGMVCDMDGTELEAMCTRVVSESDLTPTGSCTSTLADGTVATSDTTNCNLLPGSCADVDSAVATCAYIVPTTGALLCVGPPLPDFVYVAVQHASWTGTGTGTDYKIKLNSQCTQSATDPDMAWSCTTQSTCEGATHRWVTAGYCSVMDMTAAVATQATCEGAGNTWFEEAWCEPIRACDPDYEFSCTDGQCIPMSYKCDGMLSLGNAEWPADCSDGSDEGLALCEGATSPETGLPYDRYSCHTGGIGCGDCPDASTCINAGCAYDGATCSRSVGPARTVDLTCLIPPEVMTECIDEYCTRSCKQALDAWPWDDSKHGPGGTCTTAFNQLGVPIQDVAFVRAAQTTCAQRVGCPGENPREFLLGLADSFGDGWNGHTITVKQTDASGSEQTLATATLASGMAGAEPLCVQQLAAGGGFGCLTVGVDSSSDCATVTSGNCWSEEVGWSLHEVDPLTGEASLLVEAYSTTGVPGNTWTNGDAACPAASTPPTGVANPVASVQGSCAAGERQCANGAQCIPEHYLCDGDISYGNAVWGPDCSDGSDEVWQWCAHPERTEEDVPAGLQTYHNNLQQQCASGEAAFMCDSSTGCAVSGCEVCTPAAAAATAATAAALAPAPAPTPAPACEFSLSAYLSASFSLLCVSVRVFPRPAFTATTAPRTACCSLPRVSLRAASGTRTSAAWQTLPIPRYLRSARVWRLQNPAPTRAPSAPWTAISRWMRSQRRAWPPREASQLSAYPLRGARRCRR